AKRPRHLPEPLPRLQTLFPLYTIACPKSVVNYVVRGNLSIPQPERPIEDTQHPIPGLIHRAASQPQTPADLVPGPALAIAQPHKLPVSWRETPEHPTNDCGIRKHLTMLGDPPLLGGFMRPSGRCPALVCSAYSRRWVLQAREKVAVEFSLDHPDSLAVRHGSHPPARSPTPNAELSFGTPLRADRAGEAFSRRRAAPMGSPAHRRTLARARLPFPQPSRNSKSHSMASIAKATTATARTAITARAMTELCATISTSITASAVNGTFTPPHRMPTSHFYRESSGMCRTLIRSTSEGRPG